MTEYTATSPITVEPKPRRVAFVHDWLNGMRGGEKVLEAMLEVLPDADVYTLLLERDKISPTIASRPITTSFVQRLPFARRLYRYYLPLFPRAVERFDLSAYDLVVSTSHCVAKGARVPHGLHVSYIHTPPRYLYGFHQVRGKLIIITEGIFDVWRIGKNAVASFGVGLSAAQRHLLYTEAYRLILAWDGETVAEAEKEQRWWNGMGRECKVARLPDRMDPDEVIRDLGRKAWNKIILGAR